MKLCTIPGCTKALLARGWCVAHYGKWRKYGDPLAVWVAFPKPSCSIAGCRVTAHAKGLCPVHYMATKPRVRKPKKVRHRLAELWARIEWTPGCWRWSGGIEPSGYGRFYFAGERVQAHRAVYQALVGPVPDGLVLDHLCRNKACVNPAHLEPVTDRENILRGVGAPALNAAKTHCKHGHEFTPENTIRRKDGRECRACRDERCRAFRSKRRAA